ATSCGTSWSPASWTRTRTMRRASNGAVHTRPITGRGSTAADEYRGRQRVGGGGGRGRTHRRRRLRDRPDGRAPGRRTVHHPGGQGHDGRPARDMDEPAGTHRRDELPDG